MLGSSEGVGRVMTRRSRARDARWQRCAAPALLLTTLLAGCGSGSTGTGPAGPAGGAGGYHTARPGTDGPQTGTPTPTDGSAGTGTAGGGIGSGLKSLIPGGGGSTGGSSSGGTDVAGGTTVGSPSPQPVATRTTTASTAAFSTPSKNIACWMEDSTARCDISQRTWTAPPKPASCELDYGNGLALYGGRAAVACAGDTVLGQERILAYGQAIRTGKVVCASSAVGVRCVDLSTGHGFVLAKEGYQLF